MTTDVPFRAVAIALLCCTATLCGPLAGPTSATQQTSAAEMRADGCVSPRGQLPVTRGVSVPAGNATVNATVQRVNASTIRFTYSDIEPTDRGFAPRFSTSLGNAGVRVVAASGFSIDRGGTATLLTWDGATQRPTVTVRTTATRGGGMEYDEATIQPTWALLPLPGHSRIVNVSLTDDQPGVVGTQLILLGAHTVHRRARGCHEVVLYVPAAVTPAEPPAAILDSLLTADRHLDIGWRYDTVRVFAVGDPMRPGGRAYAHEAWVHAESRFQPRNHAGVRYPPEPPRANVWLHEYLHTRQRWAGDGRIAANASWLTEALPSYYMITETERQGRLWAVNETRQWRYFNRSFQLSNTRPLTTRTGPRAREVAYTKGAYVLAALDARIRHQTYGRKSLVDVFRRLNDQQRITHRSFRRAVVAVGGASMGPWVDRYVAGSELPNAPPPPPEV